MRRMFCVGLVIALVLVGCSKSKPTAGPTVNVGKEEADRKAKDGDKKAKQREADYQLAMDAGKSAVKNKNYKGAVHSYKEALRLKPTDKAATTALESSQTLLASETRIANEAAYAKHMEEGQTALTQKKYAEALKAFTAALAAKPGDAAGTKGKTAALAFLTPPVDPTKKIEEDYKRAMAAGLAAMNSKKYLAAVTAYDDALKLKPGDLPAIKGKKAAAAARLNESDPKKVKQREEDYKLAMSAGQSALKDKKYKFAVNSFTEALRLKPGDKAATTALESSQTLLASETRIANEAAYAKHMKEGQTALTQKKYAEALKAFTAALAAKPGDAAGTKGKTAALAFLTPPVDPTKKIEEDYKRAMAAGLAAMDSKKYLAAVTAYDDALKLKPGDLPAIKGKKAAADARKAETTVDPKLKAKQEAYATALVTARAAVKSGKYGEAITAFDSALALFPGDKVAATERADAMKKAQEAANARRTAAYNEAMKQGLDAMKAKKFAEAIKAYDKALEFKPGDAAALKGKTAAADALKNAKPKVDPKAKQREEDYLLAMDAGKSAVKNKKYQFAVNSFKEALRLKPGDKAATTALESSEKLLKAEETKKPDAAYASFMKKGEEAMKAKKYLDAVTAYDEALKIKPGDPAAIKGNKEAAAARKK